ncbi:putative translation factor pelota [Aciduliprofundum sp. MAR08-339]|uniref:mRNA surveillance protein pelota n=1 Tax=Aciduliprofundum sp. (strain MAR08-339) TaxID=673860 RepID=UPI0002A49FC1|nr:putative translation factor pelota [Aciduliprofundum sp. MAR08-339]
MKVEEKERGEITVRVDNLDDLWYLSTMLGEEDLVFGYVFRKDTTSGDMKRSKKVERKKIRVGIRVKKLDFQEFSDRLRISGIIVAGPEDYLGSHQTINVGLGDEISIIKEWSVKDKELLEEAVKNSERPMVYFLGLEHGLATIAIMKTYGIQEFATLRKRGDEDDEFFGEVLAALKDAWDEKSPLIILGPGFYKEDFVNFAGSSIKNYIMVQASHGDLRGVYEVLKSGALDKILKQHRIAREEQLVEELLTEIKKEGLYAYGEEEVKNYLNMGAVKHLLISDKNYKKYRDLMNLAVQTGAEIHIISTSHEAGKILEHLGGVAALLRFR